VPDKPPKGFDALARRAREMGYGLEIPNSERLDDRYPFWEAHILEQETLYRQCMEAMQGLPFEQRIGTESFPLDADTVEDFCRDISYYRVFLEREFPRVRDHFLPWEQEDLGIPSPPFDAVELGAFISRIKPRMRYRAPYYWSIGPWRWTRDVWRAPLGKAKILLLLCALSFSALQLQLGLQVMELATAESASTVRRPDPPYSPLEVQRYQRQLELDRLADDLRKRADAVGWQNAVPGPPFEETSLALVQTQVEDSEKRHQQVLGLASRAEAIGWSAPLQAPYSPEEVTRIEEQLEESERLHPQVINLRARAVTIGWVPDTTPPYSAMEIADRMVQLEESEALHPEAKTLLARAAAAGWTPKEGADEPLDVQLAELGSGPPYAKADVEAVGQAVEETERLAARAEGLRARGLATQWEMDLVPPYSERRLRRIEEDLSKVERGAEAFRQLVGDGGFHRRDTLWWGSTVPVWLHPEEEIKFYFPMPYDIGDVAEMRRCIAEAKIAIGGLASSCICGTPRFQMSSDLDCRYEKASIIWLSEKDCEGIVQKDRHLCRSDDCEAIVQNRKGDCDSDDCEAIIDGDRYDCVSGDCKAVIEQNAYRCSSRNCRAIIEGDRWLCE
jgi:hypothetical protein